MNFVTVRVFYQYPSEETPRTYSKDYTVPDNEPFPQNHAFKQWQRDNSLPHVLINQVGSEIVEQTADAPVIQLPLGFCETKYPGYFWNAHEQKLYSLKSGVLKPLQRRQWQGRYGPFDGYTVSHLGKPRYLTHESLLKLVPTRAVIPTQPAPKRPGSRWS